MDPTYPDHRLDESFSQAPRSRTNSGVSTTEGLLRSLQLADSPANTSLDPTYSCSRPASLRSRTSPALTSPDPTSVAFRPALTSHTQSTFSLPLDEELDVSWFDNTQSTAQGTPLLRVDPAETYSQLTPSSSPPSNPQSATMSTVALQYDSTFDMAGRSLFSWPVLDSSGGLLGHDLGSYASDASLTPPSGSRSATASPPIGTLTAGQREIKRQRDHARHSSKLAARSGRTSSGSSYGHSPPVTMADLTTSGAGLPIYPSASSPIPSQPYLPSFSPPIADQSQAGMYSNPYPQQQYMSVDYSPNYSASTAPSLPSNYGRPTMTDPNLLYSSSAASSMGMGSPSASAQHQHQQQEEGVGAGSSHVRVVQGRPKPQCWDHGCNGRQFSTFSNLLRHQREKSGQAAKATCPNCGAEFTRTTARNGHLLHDKCRQKKPGGGES